MRRVTHSVISGVLIGVLVLGVAWATAGLIPGPSGTRDAGRHPHRHGVDAATVAEASSTVVGQRLPDGLFYVGAANESIAPVSVADGGPWIRHGKDGNCSRLPGDATLHTPLSNESCLRTFDSEWATGVDEAHNLGIYARALAISNGETTIAFAALDTVSWFYGYEPKFCPDDPSSPTPNDTCGARAIAESLSQELGIPAQNFVIAATHTHASADTAKGSPSWYFELVRDATKTAIRNAVTNMQLATLETGSIPAKAFNIDRRIVTRAFPDYELTWLRAMSVPGAAPPPPTETSPSPVDEKPGNAGGHGKPGNPHYSTPTPTPSPTTTEPDTPRTIATLVNYSVHTTITAGNMDIHSGLVGHLEERLRERWGGTTVFIPGGLGDQTVNRGFGRQGHGYGLADLIVASATQSGHTLQSNSILTAQQVIVVPADNLSLAAANKAGVFVRDSTIPGPHAHGPSTSIQQKGGARTPSCVGASAISAKTPVGGFLIGTAGSGDPNTAGFAGDSIAIMQAPGEIFSSISAITKDYLSRAGNVMVLGMANDHLGYIIPSEQYDTRSANAAGLAQPSVRTFNYEESLSTGRCTGDQVQNALLEVGNALGIMGLGERR